MPPMPDQPPNNLNQEMVTGTNMFLTTANHAKIELTKAELEKVKRQYENLRTVYNDTFKRANSIIASLVRRDRQFRYAISAKNSEIEYLKRKHNSSTYERRVSRRVDDAEDLESFPSGDITSPTITDAPPVNGGLLSHSLNEEKKLEKMAVLLEVLTNEFNAS